MKWDLTTHPIRQQMISSQQKSNKDALGCPKHVESGQNIVVF
jgi:hypothetical protein